MKQKTTVHFRKRNFSGLTKFKLFLSTVLLCGFLSYNSFAQYPCYITGVSLFPSNPSQTDIIKSACAYSFFYQPCTLDSSNITIHNFIIKIYEHYSVGGAGSPCTGIDSANIGQLVNGNYMLIYNVSGYGINTWNCSDTINFYVSPITNLPESPKHELFIIITQNTSNNILTIKTDLQSEIEILNINGEVIKRLQTKDAKTDIDISGFSSGVYIIKATTDKGIATGKFIKE